MGRKKKNIYPCEESNQPLLTCRNDVRCSFLCTLEARRLSSEAM